MASDGYYRQCSKTCPPPNNLLTGNSRLAFKKQCSKINGNLSPGDKDLSSEPVTYHVLGYFLKLQNEDKLFGDQNESKYFIKQLAAAFSKNKVFICPMSLHFSLKFFHLKEVAKSLL